jgi:hypothetical protein
LVTPLEGTFSNFHEAFTQLHLGQLRATLKYITGDRRDRGIDPNTDHITRNNSSYIPRKDEDLVIIRLINTIGRHHTNITSLFLLPRL